VYLFVQVSRQSPTKLMKQSSRDCNKFCSLIAQLKIPLPPFPHSLIAQLNIPLPHSPIQCCVITHDLHDVFSRCTTLLQFSSTFSFNIEWGRGGYAKEKLFIDSLRMYMFVPSFLSMIVWRLYKGIGDLSLYVGHYVWKNVRLQMVFVDTKNGHFWHLIVFIVTQRLFSVEFKSS